MVPLFRGQLERYLQMVLLSGGPARMLCAKCRRIHGWSALHIRQLSKNRQNNFSYNMYGFAINRISKKTTICISWFLGGIPGRREIIF